MSLWNFHRQTMVAGALQILLLVTALTRVAAAPLTLYSTQFENFNPTNDLIGQNGWIGDGEGGNGVGEELFPFTGFGQSAYIGFAPPTTNGLTVWRPVNHNPTNLPIVTVTLDMTVYDSSNTNRRDEFRWSVYNTQGQRLFCVIFDNYDLGIYHQLDTGPWKWNDWFFANEDVYALKIQMNFSANRWDAWLGTTHIITNELITTTNAARTFGDVDAVWLRRPDLNAVAGDNYMVFDNLLITAEAITVPAPKLSAPIPVAGGQYLIRVSGTEGAKFAVQASTNLTSWTALKTNVITGGYFDYLDTTAVGLPRRYYRAKWVP